MPPGYALGVLLETNHARSQKRRAFELADEASVLLYRVTEGLLKEVLPIETEKVLSRFARALRDD